MNFYLEQFINHFKRPKTPEGIAKKIILLIKYEVIKCCTNPKFKSEIGFEKMNADCQADILREMTINGICFTVMTFQSLAEITKSQEKSQFYLEIAVEVRSCYGNYLKAKNTDSKTIDYWNENTGKRLNDFEIVFKKQGKRLKPMPENNPWVFVSAITLLAYLRYNKISEKDPLVPLINTWVGKVEKAIFETLKTA